MAPHITTWQDLAFFDERTDDETDEALHTSFAMFDTDENAYIGQLNQTKSTIDLKRISPALKPVSDEDLYPEWAPYSTELTEAHDAPSTSIYVKHPNIFSYEVFKRYNVLHLIPQDLLEEARAMEFISQYPHPNIIRYHGCRVRRNRITGLILDHHSLTLSDALKNNEPVDKDLFMQALTSAIHHLHSLGWAHNDLHPGNILLDGKSMPILIDFGSARKEGTKLGSSRGTKAWIEGDIKDYHTSEKGHDLFALDKIRAWIYSPTFSDEEN